MSAEATSASAASNSGAAMEGSMLSGAAGRYAVALFEFAQEAGALEAVESDLKSLGRSISETADFNSFLKSPIHGAEDKARAIAAIAEKAGYGELVRNFLGLVARNRRLFVLENMISAFMARLAAHRGEVGAQAVSAAPLTDDQVRRLRGEIESIVGKAVNLETKVDADLLGGLVVKVGSTMIDSSLRTKLNKLKSVMKEA